jgi:hypothetical protein
MSASDLAGQIGIGAAAVVLFLTVGKSYINYIGTQLKDERAAHEKEIDRLSELWKERLASEVRRGDAWETAASKHQQANLETTEQLRRLTPAVETTVALLNALRDQGRR